MPADSADLAARLLDAHVAQQRRQLTDPHEFAALVDEEITAFLDVADHLPLETAVSRDLIKAVARKYAIAFPVDGEIPGLVGAVAERLYQYSADHDTRLQEVLDRRRFEELATGIADLGLSRRIVERVLTSPASEDACVEAVQRAVDPSRLPGKLAGIVETLVERVARRGTRYVLAVNSAESDHLILDAAREMWLWLASTDEQADQVRDILSDGDVEDTIVLVFEFWRSFRETPYFGALLDEGIDEVFDTYGQTPLSEILDELGIARTDLVEEAMRFGPPVITQLDSDGIVESALRRRLAPFYASDEFAAILASD
ncbi:MAG: hypothetical protein WBA38_13555 [Gordonia sp. (in: high G+C Gram-positive bacteria)]|uniref:hypothetical protein n=1 Tax=Gordonia sp. (in: high G+C Gram-positive bacteria) TaxID=84139 RepID=UPI003C73667C